MTETEKCPETVAEAGGFHWHACGRPVKRDGMCGIHAAAKDRIARNDADRKARKAEAQIVADRLMAHGVYAYASTDGTARISMSATALADLLDDLSATSPAPTANGAS